MTTRMPLFINKSQRDEVDDLFSEKTASARLSSDPRMWEEEIIQNVARELPYIENLNELDIHFDRTDLSKGAAVGSVIIGETGVNLPFIISKSRMGDEPEMKPFDVYEHKGVIRPLTPTSIKQALLSLPMGAPVGQEQKRMVRGGNMYVGEMTGDVSPLEFTPQAGSAPFAKTGSAAGATAKGAARGAILGGITGTGLQATRELESMDRQAQASGKKVTNKDRAHALARAITRGGSIGALVGGAHAVARKGLGVEEQYRTISKVATAADFLKKVAGVMGDNDVEQFRRIVVDNPMMLHGESIASLDFILRSRGTVDAKVHTKAPNIMIVRRDMLTDAVTVKFPGSAEQVIKSRKELEDLLGPNFDAAMKKLETKGLYVATENIGQTSWSFRRPSNSSMAEISRQGLFSVALRGNGMTVPAGVIQSVFAANGGGTKLKLAVTGDGRFAYSERFFGTPMGDSLNGWRTTDPKAGRLGCLVIMIGNRAVASTPLRVRNITSIASLNEPNRATMMISCVDEHTGVKVNFIPTRAVNSPIPVNSASTLNPVMRKAGDLAVYIPENAQWIEFSKPIAAAGHQVDLTKVAAEAASDVRVQRLGDNDWTVSMRGAGLNGLTDTSCFELLVGMGITNADDLVDIEKVAQVTAENPDGILIAGLHAPQGHGEITETEKTATADLVIDSPLARNVAAATKQIVTPGLMKAAQETKNEETVNSILSLNFLSTENMRMFVDNLDTFEKVGNDLAKLLVATRLGLEHVREASVKEAMEGIARTCDQLRLLKSDYVYRKEKAHGDV